jgi:hypothetical protein
MRKTLVLLALLSAVTVARAETIATLTNKAGGKIVLTDRPCVYKGTTHDKLNFVYNYGSSGYSSEGCWGIEGDVVSVVWFDSEGTMRYPLANFVINQSYTKKKGNSNGYRY